MRKTLGLAALVLAAAAAAQADEDAASDLRRAIARLDPAAADERAKLAARLQALDPRAPAFGTARRTVAGRLVTVSEVFRKQRWYRVALHFLREAERFDAAAARDPLARLRRLSRRTFGNPVPEPSFEFARKSERDWHAFQAKDLFDAGWRLDSEVVTSPAVEKGGRPSYALCSSPAHTDGIISVEAQRQPNHGVAGILFGWAGDKDYFYYVLEYGMNVSSVALFHYLDDKWKPLGSASCRIAKAERSGWLRQGVRIDGKKIELMVGDRSVVKVECEREPHGKFGMFVSGAGGAMTPVTFRRPRFGPLVAKPKEDPKVLEDRARFRHLAGRLGEALGALRRDKELALLHALRVRRDADDLRDPESRQSVLERARDIAAQAYSEQTEVDAELANAAKSLLPVARAYQDAAWSRTAAAIVRHAAGLDDRCVVAIRAQFLAAAKRQATKPKAAAVGAAAEGVADNALIEKWFVGGRRFQGKPWKFTKEWVESDVSSIGEQLIASTRKLGKAAKFRLQVKAGEKPSYFGVVIGFKGWYRHHVLTIAHSYTTSELALKCKVDGEFTNHVGSKKSTTFAKALKKGWMTIEIEYTGEGKLTARIGDQTLRFDVGDEDLSGKIGLYHRVGYGGPPVRFRNLVIERGEAGK